MKSGCTLEPVPNGSGATVCVTLVYCGQTFGQIKLKRGTQVGLGHGHIVLDVPQFSAHLYCAETAGWIKMPHGMELGLGQGHSVLDGDPLPPPKRGITPIFGPCLLWPNSWMHQDATGYGSRPQLMPHCARWGPSSPSLRKGAQPTPNFRPVFVVAKRLYGSRCHLVRW